VSAPLNKDVGAHVDDLLHRDFATLQIDKAAIFPARMQGIPLRSLLPWPAGTMDFAAEPADVIPDGPKCPNQDLLCEGCPVWFEHQIATLKVAH
jgi:hypothetical protein